MQPGYLRPAAGESLPEAFKNVREHRTIFTGSSTEGGAMTEGGEGLVPRRYTSERAAEPQGLCSMAASRGSSVRGRRNERPSWVPGRTSTNREVAGGFA